MTYGVRIGRIYWRYYELVEDMKQSARFAQTQSDDVIRRNLMQRVDELGIPAEAKRFGIRRAGPPWRILIRSEYRERLDLPIGPPRYILFKPGWSPDSEYRWSRLSARGVSHPPRRAAPDTGPPSVRYLPIPMQTRGA